MKLKLTAILRKASPISDGAKNRLRMNMSHSIAEETIGDYELHLIGSPLAPWPQIALQRAGRDFTDLDQQFDETAFAPGKFDLGKVKSVIQNWLSEHGPLMVGTFDEKKIKSYKSLLARLRFKTEARNFGPFEFLVINP